MYKIYQLPELRRLMPELRSYENQKLKIYRMYVCNLSYIKIIKRLSVMTRFATCQ
jgi:hypothetical protein